MSALGLLLPRRKTCPACDSDRLRPSSRSYGRLVALFGFEAWRCRDCRHRFARLGRSSRQPVEPERGLSGWRRS